MFQCIAIQCSISGGVESDRGDNNMVCSNVGLVSIQYHHKAGTLVSTVGCNSRVPLITISGNWAQTLKWAVGHSFL